MGSEHYCLRWNNHQSNLLGVFSQLLQDESLVDVTLACSEGAPIRAHKVVLSACSSYFQSLFLDHPEKHPIVILKDVRFAELQTLVEFMYKGEVNVQYCQLSALLKTAESLKVKGLAEMTNQNTTLREPEREPERLRPHSQPCKRSNSCDSPVDATLSGPSTSAATSAAAAAAAASISSTQHAAALAASALITSNAASSTSATTNATTCTIATPATSLTSAVYSTSSSHQASSVSSKREHPSERCSTSPPKRLHTKREQDSPLPLDLYQRRLEHQQQQQEDTKENSIVNNNNTNEKHRSTTPQTSSGTIQQKHSNSSTGDGGGSSADGIKKHEDLERDSVRSFNSPDRLARHDVNRPLDETMGAGVEGTAGGVEKIEDVEDVEYGDEEMELDDDGDNNSEDVCLNMKIRSSSLAAALVSPQLTTPRGLESSGHVGIGSGIGGIEGGADSARSTPLTTTIPLVFDTHSQRPASRSSREGSGLDRPSSRGGLSGLPSTSASAMAGGLSPVSSSAAALNLHSDCVAGSSGLGPVQSVPLSLKKEIDCSEDDNSNSRHHLQPRSASASGVLGGEFDYRTSHESLLRNFGMATRCPTPFAFPFTPLGLSLFDIDPSRILTMLHHQTWLAEEALRNRGLLTPPPTSKDFSQRFNPLSDLLSKDYHANHMHLNTAELLARSSLSSVAAASAAHLGAPTDLANKQQQQQHRSITQQHQYKPQQQQPQPPFNIRYPSPAAFFHQQQLQQQLQTQKLSKSTRQSTPSPQQTATTNCHSLLSGGSSSTSMSSLHKSSERSLTPCRKNDDDNDGVVELTTSHHDEAAAIRDRDSGNSSAATTSSITSSMLYKDSLEQLLQRRHSSGVLTGDASLKSYSQLLMNSTTPTDTSSCKEKSSSSSTSSTPPPAPGTPGQFSLSRSSLLKSPSDTSSLFSEPIEEETRCIVCNAQFPNVWLLEQHAALQHPLLGPGEEKPFICEQCGQSYRYRSAYAKHKETNHRARLPADKLFTCDVCGMQFRYLKSFKKHRLNHALERLHGKKGKNPFAAHIQQQMQEHEMVSSSQESNMMMADTETVEDLRINIKKERDEEEQQQQMLQQQQQKHDEDQDATVDSASVISYQENQATSNTTLQASNNNTNEPNISSSEGIHSTNKRPRLLQATSLGTHIETDSPYHPNHQQQHTPPQHHGHALVHHPHLAPQLPGHLAHNMSAMAAAAAAATTPQHQQQMTPQTAQQAAVAAAAAAANSMNSLSSLNSITSLINAERLPNEQFLGLNPQEASILNFLRVDAQERQRDKRPPASRFACPFCGKCVRSKENLKLHVRKHTGERPFVCLFCGRAFGGKSDLTRHLRIHTGERPYHCESCGKCFARADYLSKHLTTHIHNAPR